MAEGDAEGEGEKKGGGMMPLVIGLVLALLLGGGAAYGVMSGLVPLPFGGDETASAETEAESEPEEAPVFVEFDPIEITIGSAQAPRRLRLRFALETVADRQAAVEAVKPRILDALNSVLRAVEPEDLARPASLDRLRAQLTRRVRIAVDPGAVRDLLILEYVIL